MKAKTVWWVTCSDCRNNGLDTTEECVSEAYRRAWKATHVATTGHDRFVVWDETEGLAGSSA